MFILCNVKFMYACMHAWVCISAWRPRVRAFNWFGSNEITWTIQRRKYIKSIWLQHTNSNRKSITHVQRIKRRKKRVKKKSNSNIEWIVVLFFEMETCLLKNKSDHLHRYQRFMGTEATIAWNIVSHRHKRRWRHKQQQQRQQYLQSKPSTMSLNKTLKVFVNGAWITWIYLVAIFIRFEYVDAKIGNIFLFTRFPNTHTHVHIE